MFRFAIATLKTTKCKQVFDLPQAPERVRVYREAPP
jgi:hypothetical protein